MIEVSLIASLVTEALKSMKWRVREDTDSSRYDLYVTDPNGKVYIIELKGGEEPMHFAAVAQLERVAHQLSEREGEAVTPVLLTTQDVRPSISELAEQVGVHVVEATGSEQEAADSVVQTLEASANP